MLKGEPVLTPCSHITSLAHAGNNSLSLQLQSSKFTSL
jgi:hypothetical protein